MKTKLLITAFAAAAMLMGGTSTATAQGVRHRDMGGIKHKMERRFDNRTLTKDLRWLIAQQWEHVSLSVRAMVVSYPTTVSACCLPVEYSTARFARQTDLFTS